MTRKSGDGAGPVSGPKDADGASGAGIAAKNAARSAAALTPAGKVGAIAPGASLVDQMADDAVDDAELKMRELLRSVTEEAKLKRGDVREVLELALHQMGQALAEGRAITLPGLGKIKVKRAKIAGSNRVSELRLRQDVSDHPDAGGTDDAKDGAVSRKNAGADGVAKPGD